MEWRKLHPGGDAPAGGTEAAAEETQHEAYRRAELERTCGGGYVG